MKLRVDSADDVSKEISERRSKPWKNFLRPVHVLSVNEQPFSIPVYVPAEESDEARLIILWSLEDEDGHTEEFAMSGGAIRISEWKWIDGVRYVRLDLVDRKRREIGYYSLHATCRYAGRICAGGCRTFSGTSKIILAPDTCFLPEELQTGRAWGISLNLYSVRSRRNWGIGDFGDLRRIVGWTAGLKGDFVGINPLHAIPNTRPLGISPYSPISRIYRNFIYLDVENIPEVKDTREAAQIRASRKFAKELEELRKAEGSSPRLLGNLVRPLPGGNSTLCGVAEQIRGSGFAGDWHFHGRRACACPRLLPAFPHQLSGRYGRRENGRALRRSARLAHRLPHRPRWPDRSPTHGGDGCIGSRAGDSRSSATSITTVVRD